MTLRSASLNLCLLCIGLMTACGSQRAVVRDSKDYASTPRLPSPHSGTYARATSTPNDPVIAAIMGQHKWDASLSGAAAGLAVGRLMNNRAVTAWRAREG